MSSLIYIRMIHPITWWRHVVSRWKITWLILLKKKLPMILEFNRSFQIEDHTSILVTCQQVVITFGHQVEIYWAIMRRHLAVINVLSVRIVHRLNQKTVLQKFFIAQIVEIRLVISDFLVSIFIQNKVNKIMTRHFKSFTIPTKVGFRPLVTLQHVDSIETNNSAPAYRFFSKDISYVWLFDPFVTNSRQIWPDFDQIIQVHGGPKGDVCLGKLKCHHYICISCFSDVKFHSKCQICHKSFKKNDIKFEYLSPNSNWILPKSNFQKFLKINCLLRSKMKFWKIDLLQFWRQMFLNSSLQVE